MADGGGAAASGGLGSALRLRFASLPTRIIVPVFSAALVAGVAVALIATGSTQSFLRSKIDERFAKLLETAPRTLDRWYEQREHDLATFASSETVVTSLAGRHAAERAHDEARHYLDYVQDGFPQYQALFVLDADAVIRVSVGADLELPLPLRERLAAVTEPEVSGVLASRGAPFQLISAPVRHRGEALGTLHAAIPIEALEGLLAFDELDASTGLYLIGPAATVIARSPGAPERKRFEHPLPRPGARRVVGDYSTADGRHVIGRAMPYDRFDWTLAVEQDYDVAFAPVVGTIRQVLAINVGIVLVFGVIALLIARSIVRPIRALSERARRIAQGDTDVEIPPEPGQDEIGVLSRALHEMVERLRRNQVELQRKQGEIARANDGLTRMNQELQRNNEMLEQLSFTDGLTRLHNHRYFQDRLRVEVRRCDRTREPLALLLADIDDFKALNDCHGHAIGDDVLRQVAMILNGEVRDTDLPARYGGEEFAVLAPRTGAEGAATLAEKLRQAVSAARFRNLGVDDAGALSVTVSIGVSVYAGDPRRLFNEADRALYRAKAEGKDCVVLFDPDADGASAG